MDLDDCDSNVIGKKSFVKRKASDMSEEKNSSCWEVKAKFQNLTYWNHDTLPSHDDAFSRSFHWLSVAEAVNFCFITVVQKHKTWYTNKSNAKDTNFFHKLLRW